MHLAPAVHLRAQAASPLLSSVEQKVAMQLPGSPTGVGLKGTPGTTRMVILLNLHLQFLPVGGWFGFSGLALEY